MQRAALMVGAPNFRDLGGYSSRDGKRVAWRKVFRSGSLAQLNDADLEKMKELGIKTIVDFRGTDEAALEPSRCPEGVTIIHLPVGVGHIDTASIMQHLMSGAIDSAQSIAFMKETNRLFVTDFATQYREFFRILLQPERYPLVFHCTAGKDRTGFAAAMLLSALDVEWDTIMEDYLLTNQYVKPPAHLTGVPDEALPALRQVWGVQPEFLGAAKAEIIQQYGSIERYLFQVLKIGNEEKARLKRYLLS
jgi:protein-tyrosine phosphatase